MRTTRLQKQNMIQQSSLLMSLDFVRVILDLGLSFECRNYALISVLEDKSDTRIRQPRCRNGG